LRHFADDAIIFSSFTYLIDSARLLALVFHVAHETGESFDMVVSNIDTKLVGWTLNLPKEKQQLVGDGGKVDELIFQAHVLINTQVSRLYFPSPPPSFELQDLYADPVSELPYTFIDRDRS
jgi:hypothetical protein